MNPYVNIDTIIEKTFVLLATHPLIRQPSVRNSAGETIKITRFKNDDGFDENQDGLTLAIFPYTYEGSSNETVGTGNAALVYEHYHVGSGTTNPAFDRCRVHLIVKLQALSANRVKSVENHDGIQITFVRNEVERALRKWMEQLRTILLTNPMNKLLGLVRNSHVNFISFRTSKWNEDTNAVLHEASLLWQLEIDSPRNWKTWPIYNPLDGVDNWEYLGVELRTGTPIYYDYASKNIVYVNGFPITSTPAPGNIPVVWDPIQQRFERVNGTPLTPTELIDPATGKTWIDNTLKLVGVIKAPLPFNQLTQNVYWNTVSLKLELADGTEVTEVDDNLLTYNPTTEVLSIEYPGESPRPVNSNSDPIYLIGTSHVNIYDANGVVLTESFEI